MSDTKSRSFKDRLRKNERPTPTETPPPEGAALQRARGAPLGLSTTITTDTLNLTEHERELLEQLSPDEQTISLHFRVAWRQTHESLLEAARWMAQARDTIEHGRWSTFLAFAGVSDDMSEMLRHIHYRAQAHPRFAEEVRRGRLGTTAAGLLADPKVPMQFVDDVLDASELPKTKTLERRISSVKRELRAGQIPRYAESQAAQIPRYAEFAEASAATIEPLSSNERALIDTLLIKVEQYTQHPASLSAADWQLLASLAQRLGELLRTIPSQPEQP